jgi:YesN/AraC family two-component response regulator
LRDQINANSTGPITSNKNGIANETEKDLLARLENFENFELFLKKDITLTSVSTMFSTNTKYLSEIIKKYRSQNFNNYINSLRIDYIVHKLYSEPRYRDYKISYLADQCGFATYQVFILAFRKQNGVTPSYFIQNLKDDNVMLKD